LATFIKCLLLFKCEVIIADASARLDASWLALFSHKLRGYRRCGRFVTHSAHLTCASGSLLIIYARVPIDNNMFGKLLLLIIEIFNINSASKVFLAVVGEVLITIGVIDRHK